jgi:hypothetical protein
MDEADGDVMLAIELTQETQKAGDVGGTVFIEPVEAHEGGRVAAAWAAEP